MSLVIRTITVTLCQPNLTDINVQVSVVCDVSTMYMNRCEKKMFA